jgi:hypothetical protein
MKVFIHLLILCTLCIANLRAQKGFQFGIGAGYMVLEGEDTALPFFKKELKDYRIKGGNPIYFEVKADYAFSCHWQLRSGVQWRWRSISVYEGDSDTKTHLSVPLIANYRLPLNSKRDLVVGLNAGIAIDNYIPNSTGVRYTSEALNPNGSIIYTVKNNVTNYIYNGNFLSFNGSFRVGIEVEKDYGTKGRIGLQLMYNYERGNSAKTISQLEKTVYNAAMPPEIDHVVKEQIEFDEDQTGYQIGLYYYFGSFNANKK